MKSDGIYYDEDSCGYESVSNRKERMLLDLKNMIESGETLNPIAPFKTRSISKSFWGKAWCRHIENFCDYDHNLPSGRSYVKNGAVFDLQILDGEIRAMVSCSELFELTIFIEPLDPEKWQEICQKARGQISSVVELLQGKMPSEIMEFVIDPELGIFPAPSDIRFVCNCTDWADLCRHSAAAMYGVGVRLDEQPELLFKLRGVNHEDLISTEQVVDELVGGTKASRRRRISDSSASDVFGIELD